MILALWWSLTGIVLSAQTVATATDTAVLGDVRLAGVDHAQLLHELRDYNDYMGAAGTPVDTSLLPARIKSFILIHPGYWISLLKFGELVRAGRVTRAAERFQSFSSGLRASALGQSVQGFIRADEARLGPGKVAPDFRAQTPEEKGVTLHEMRGQYVLLDFWASWCAPCRMENPFIVEDYQRYREKGFTVLSFSLDENKAAWQGAIKADGLEWQHASDLQGWHSEIVKTYMVTQVPRNFLIDPEGKIVAVDLRGDELRRELEKLFNK